MIIESWASLLFVVFSSLSLSFIVKHLRLPFPAKPTIKPPLPPAASPLPLFSHLLLRRGSLREIELLLRRLHSQHGPILTLRLFPGAPPAVFVSDASLAHAALIRYGDTFADRPPAVEPTIFLTAGNHDISSSNYGPLWRLLRRNLSSETLHRLSLFSPARRLITQLLLDKLRSNSGRRFIAKESFQYVVLSILLLMCFGEKLGESSTREIQSLQAFLLSLFTTLNVFAFFPSVTKLLFHRKWEKIVAARRRQAEIFLQIIRARQERKQSMKGGGNDGGLIEHCYVDSLLDLRLPVEGGRGLTDDEMVNLCHEFLSGAATTTTALEWTMAEVVKHRSVQRKLSEEIESTVGREAEEDQIKEEDLQRMPYLKAVVMEALRLHPPSHFVLPHSVTEEVVLDGFLIPKGAEVHFSVADVNWDRRKWEEPMEFRPERFMAGGEGEGVDITGSREMRMLTFGAGRRMCPGYGLAMLHLELLVANLVREFEWKPAAGEEVDLSERLDFTTVMNNPLTVQIAPRRKVEKKDFIVDGRVVKPFNLKDTSNFFYDVMAELRQDGLIVEQHVTLLDRTPFHYILQLPYLALNHSLIKELLLQYDNTDSSFSIAGHRLEFRSDDIALIFGLPKHGKTVRLRSDMKKDFYRRVFDKGSDSRYDVIYHLRRHARDQSADAAETFVVLLIGLFIGTVLIPSSNTSIASSLWNYLEDIDHISDYAWAALVHQRLLDDICRARSQMVEEDANGDSYVGCFLALQLWICEIAERQGFRPRILGWGKNSMNAILEKFMHLHSSDIRLALSPLESERHLIDSSVLPCESNAGSSPAAQLHEEDDQDQKWKNQPSFFSNEDQNITSIYKGDKQSIASIDPQELEFLRRCIVEQDQRILKLEKEVQILKAQGAPRPPSSVGNDWMGCEEASSSQQQSEQHNSHVSISAGNGSIEKTAKKTINRQSSAGRPQASSSVGRKLKEPNAYSPSMASAGGKLLASRSVKIKIKNPPRNSKGVLELNDAQVSNIEGEEAAVDMISSSGIASIEREVKKRVERQTSDNRQLCPSLRARQRELAFSQSGIGAGNKLLGSRSMKSLNRSTKII